MPFNIWFFISGHYIASTITENDRIAILGISNKVTQPGASCMKKTLVPGNYDVVHTVRHFLDYMEAHKGKICHLNPTFKVN